GAVARRPAGASGAPDAARSLEAPEGPDPHGQGCGSGPVENPRERSLDPLDPVVEAAVHRADAEGRELLDHALLLQHRGPARDPEPGLAPERDVRIRLARRRRSEDTFL